MSNMWFSIDVKNWCCDEIFLHVFRQIDVFTKQKLRFDEFFYTNFTIR